MIGTGHLSRCLALAAEFKRKNHKCHFLISNEKIKKIILEHGHSFKIIKINKNEISEIIKKIIKEKFQIVIFDSKRQIISKIIKQLKGIKKIVIDNKYATKFADLVIFPTDTELINNIKPNFLVGLEYVIINKKFINVKKKYHNNTIIISCGGSDKKNITLKLVRSLKKQVFSFNVKIVLGEFYDKIELLEKELHTDKRFEILQCPKNFDKIMKNADIGIITYGVTLFESAGAKLPTLVISHNLENNHSAKVMSKYKWFQYLGKYDQIDYDQITKKVILLFNDKSMIKIMSQANKIIDGEGPKRVCQKILSLI
jgi:UDP-2,4-diacetamido-2,4,6-trideoxy-beta-L-altropyranose hydrolase